jgi:hypothetical protein
MGTFAVLTVCSACAPASLVREEAPPLPTPAASPAGGAQPVTFFDDRPLDLPSPDRRYRLISTTSADGLTQVIAIRSSDGRRQVVGSYDPPTAVLWSPSSQSFFINDQRGSGQSSYLEVVRLEQGRFRRDVGARSKLNRLYNRLFECRLSEDSINTTGSNWIDASTLVVEVQASHHGGSCPLDPFAINQLVVVVDANTGEVLNRRAVRP